MLGNGQSYFALPIFLSQVLTVNRFTGPKITLDISELSEQQEKALRDEGLDIEVTGLNDTPSSGESAVDIPAEKKIEKAV